MKSDDGRLHLGAFVAAEDAVSPVIGVILMVAITVILAAVIGTFALGLYEGGNEAAPGVNFDTEYDDVNDELTVTHVHGEVVDSTQTSWVVSGGNGALTPNPDFSGKISSGDTATLDGVTSDETVRLVWKTKGEERSATIMKWEGPSV